MLFILSILVRQALFHLLVSIMLVVHIAHILKEGVAVRRYRRRNRRRRRGIKKKWIVIFILFIVVGSCINKIEQMRSFNGNVVSITSNSNSTISKSSDISFSIPDDNIADNKNEGFTTFFGDSINLLEQIFSKIL